VRGRFFLLTNYAQHMPSCACQTSCGEGRSHAKAQRTVGTPKLLRFAPAPVKSKVSARDARLGYIRSVRAVFELTGLSQ
jgi:hypothetical protein